MNIWFSSCSLSLLHFGNPVSQKIIWYWNFHYFFFKLVINLNLKFSPRRYEFLSYSLQIIKVIILMNNSTFHSFWSFIRLVRTINII
jgi:hypothetical protein